MTRTIKLRISYDGTGYTGWQIQPHHKTVQGTIEGALRFILNETYISAKVDTKDKDNSRIFPSQTHINIRFTNKHEHPKGGFSNETHTPEKVNPKDHENRPYGRFPDEKCHLIGAGRTDAGVHALGQAAHIKTSSRIPAAGLKMALNSILPKDIAILDAIDTFPDFHARKNALAKKYIYRIYRGRTRDPFLWFYTWHLPDKLDLDRIRACLPPLCGEHDFSAFSVVDRDTRDGTRNLTELRLIEEGDELRFEFRGNGFLRKQVRRIVGTLIDVGRGRFAPEHVSEILLSKDPTQAGPTAPAKGLFLVEVYY